MPTKFNITFDNYLQEVHSLQYSGTDDDMPDNYEKWLGELDTGEVMEYAEERIKQLNLIIEKTTDLCAEAIDELQKIKLILMAGK